jgi:membrane-associated phospholipid phosphatase
MSHLTLWAPWLIVVALVVVMLIRRPQAISARAVAAEAMIVVGSYFAYYVVRGITEGSEATAVRNAEVIIDVQQSIGLYWEPRMQEFVLEYEWLTVASNWIYIWWHWPLIISAAVWLFLYNPRAYGRYRNAFLLSGAVALVFFASLPVAPPRIADPAIVDTIAVHSDVYRTYETPAFVNQYAAFPSLHFAWNVLASIALVLEARLVLVRALGLVSPVVVLLAIVVTGNHFILDAAAGALLAIVALFVAGRHLALRPAPAATPR